MKEIKFIEAYGEELETLTQMRIKFVMDISRVENRYEIEKFYAETNEYLKRMINEERYIGILGEIDGGIVCTAGILIYEMPPLITKKNRKIGHVLNFYTVPEYRGNGYGSKMMEFIKETAKNRGIKRLFLNATKCGETLYRKAGFYETEEKALVFDL